MELDKRQGNLTGMILVGSYVASSCPFLVKQHP